MARQPRTGRQPASKQSKKNSKLSKPTPSSASASTSSALPTKRTPKLTNDNDDDDDDLYNLTTIQPDISTARPRNLDDARMTAGPSRVRRTKRGGDGDSKDDKEDEGFDDDDDDSGGQPWKQGEMDDFANGVVNSEDDESIDSDEAMGEEGESTDEEEEEDDDGGDAYLASEMLDMGVPSEEESTSDSESNSDASDSNSSHSDTPSSKGFQTLESFIGTLPEDPTSRKRKDPASDSLDPDPDTNPRNTKRRILQERSEARPESEFHADHASASQTPKVDLDTLLTSLPAGSELSNLRKSLKPLQTTSSSKTGPLAAPMEYRDRQRLERSTAYDLSKDETAKWDATTRKTKGLSGKNADGRDRLVLTLAPQNPTLRAPDANRWNAQFKPTTEVESQVLSLLNAGQMSSNQLRAEEGRTHGRSAEEERERTADARLARETLYRAERKAKRVAKIKSKSYRRLRKREKAAKGDGALDMDTMKELDDIDGGDRVATSVAASEVQRAKERATLKHSSQSRWAKSVAGLQGLDDETSTAIRDRVHREEELKRCITAGGESDHESSGNEDGQGEDPDEGEQDDNAQGLLLSRGVLGMKFMKTGGATLEAVEDEPARVTGRLSFAPSTSRKDIHHGESATSSSHPSGKNIKATTTTAASARTLPTKTASGESNPWLSTTSTAPTFRAPNAAVSKAATAAQGKVAKAHQKSSSMRRHQQSEAQVELDPSATLQAGRVAVPSALPVDDDQDLGEIGGKPTLQRDLVSRAFADDGVVADFEEAKRIEVEQDASRDEDVTLPGWGSWGGKGAKRPSKKVVKHIPGIDAADRKDAKLNHVIISEKTSKRAKKYQVGKLAFPYTSKAQHDHTMSQRLAPELTTQAQHRHLVRPDVMLSNGVTIRPVTAEDME